MKKIIFIILVTILQISIHVNADCRVIDVSNPIVSSFGRPSLAHSADMDGDGDMDVIAAADSGLAWWENTSGSGDSLTEHLIVANPPFGCISVYAADMDGDGDMDVLGYAGNSGLSWWENTDGSGTSWTEHLVDNAFVAHSVYAADMDGDGDMDVLAASAYNDTIAWWENTDGSGTGWIQKVVDGAFDNPYSMYVADMDGDGDMDVLGASFGTNGISWWENSDGSGTNWIEHLVDGAFDGASSVYAADMDGDGDMDVIGSAFIADDIAWWENADGSGTNWTEHLVDGDLVDCRSVYAADMDGDGDMDVLGCAGNSGFAWWENADGSGTSWTKHLVNNSPDSCISVCAADMDGDGDKDVLGAVNYSDAIAWWENTDGSGTNWIEHLVDGAFDGARSVYAADIDGDGDMDVLGAAAIDGDIAWWENTNGSGTNWADHLVDGAFNGASAVCAADMDGDGDMDILGAAATDGDIAWWENTDGKGTNWADHMVDGAFDGACSVYAADMDGDGDMDVLGAAATDGDVTWWENTDGKGTGWIEHLVDGAFDGAQSVYAADMDGDGDMDVIAAADYNGLAWWENTNGSGTSWIEHVVDGDLVYCKSVHAADMDGDGDMDVIAAVRGSDVTWWENADGNGNSWAEYIVDDYFFNANSIYAADMDGDGDMDILAAGDNIYAVAWWENITGSGGKMWFENLIGDYSDSLVANSAVYAADMNGDGDMDVLGADSDSGAITWWGDDYGDADSDGLIDPIENATCTDPEDSDTDNDGIPDGTEDANHNGILDAGETNPCSADTDSDGIQDGTEIGLTLADIGPDTDAGVFIPDADPTTTTNPLDDDSDNDGRLDGEEDLNHNGAVDGEETDPNAAERTSAMPWIPLLLLE